MLSIADKIARELNVRLSQVDTAIRLLDDGDTVPFISRYRKEATEGLDDTQLRCLEDRLSYLRELQERREVILKSITEQEKLTPELEKAINSAETRANLEDLYLPYRPKRRTKASMAKDAGLEPLAMTLWENPEQSPEEVAKEYVSEEKSVGDVDAALEGARHILMEHFSEDAGLLNDLREYLWTKAELAAKVVPAKKASGKKFSDYFDFQQAINKIPSHRALALFRGRREGVLQLSLALPEETVPSYGEIAIAAKFAISDKKRAADRWLLDTVHKTWKIKLLTKLELEVMTRLRELAEEEAIKVFSSNLGDLLLAAPAGEKVTMGLDPGIRTGVKVAVVDATGKLLDYTTIYPLAPQNDWHPSIAELAKLVAKHGVSLVSIGNGTGSRETDRLVGDLIKAYPDLALNKITVSEAGASVYSASELAAREFPDLDVSLRGAVSIARRVQDPLAELVKIEPKAIGVGQYQHDVNQARLGRCLESVIEDCVNAVGVDVNTASVALLRRVSGLSERLAKNIVEYRDEHGSFDSRETLKAINGIGEKTFQQSAGFLRIPNASNPLDASAVHPESYPVVEKICQLSGKDIQDIVGDKALLKSVNAEDYVDEQVGLPTIVDILNELEKPGRDPRPEFKTASFKEGVEAIADLSLGMSLEGVVSNVTKFGAFVDIGVHQDGLVHISELTNQFVDDPRKVVKAGDIVSVRVIEVDLERKRIGLSMKPAEAKDSRPAAVKPRKERPQRRPSKPAHKPQAVKKKPKAPAAPINSAMADAFAKLKAKK